MSLKFNEEKQQKRLDELHSKEAEDLAQILAARYNLPYLDLTKFPINTDALRVIPEAEARSANLAAFKIVGKTLHLAIASPKNELTQKILADLRDRDFKAMLYLVSEASLGRAWGRYAEISQSVKTKAGVIEISDEEVAALADELVDLAEIKKRLAAETTAAGKIGVSSLLEIVLAGGARIGVSDIHIEPEETETRLRFRLDGVLNDIIFFQPKLYQQILSRVKLIAGLKLNVKTSPQDGRFSIRIKNVDVEVRTSVLPGAYGESIVLRLLNPETIKIGFEELGLEPTLEKIVLTEIARPNGLILLTGPTGSGKTTSLYAFLRRINSPDSKIITIEDPVEYHLEGINQTQVDRAKNYTFLSGLRSALRQDPDVIMVGEIRDAETAGIAINAALTGHLVFSTLHTNNAAGTIPRLIDLGVNPKIIDSALTLAMAQRLVRKLCSHCRESYPLVGTDKQLIEQILAGAKEKRPDLNLETPEALWRAKGCKECHLTGYRGRLGVFEAIRMDEAVGKLIKQNPSEREIKNAVRPQGILDMREDGVVKVIRGITSLDELSRVVELDL